jgi:signal transduction protein with GAF and PtsI domain
MSSSEARRLRRKNAKLRDKAKLMILKEYPKLMEDPEMRRKTFEAVDNANIAVDSKGQIQIMYEQNNDDLKNLK